MLRVALKAELKPEQSTEGIADSVQPPVSGCLDDPFFAVLDNGHARADSVLLHKMALGHGKRRLDVDVGLPEDFIDFFRFQLLVVDVGDMLDRVSEVLSHLGGEIETVFLFEKVADAPLARLRVDANDIAVVLPADVLGVDEKIGDSPIFLVVRGTVRHALCDGVLMRTRKRREHELSRVGLAVIHPHARHLFIDGHDLGHIREVQPRVHALRIHVHGKGHDVHVARALPVAEERALYAIRAREQSHLRVSHAAPPIVVRVQGDDDVFAVLEVVAHVFDLRGIDVRHGHGNRRGQVDDDLVVRVGLPNVQNAVADFERKFGFRARKALGGIFKKNLSLRLLPVPVAEFRPEFRDADDFLFGFLEDLLPLRDGSRVVEVYHRALAAFHRLEGLFDDVLPALREHLNGHVLGNQVLLDERAAEGIFGLGGGGKSDLDLLEPDLAQEGEELELFLEGHGHDEGLVAVPQVHAAPNGRAFDVVLLDPLHLGYGGHEVADLVLFYVFHLKTPSALILGARGKKKVPVSYRDGKPAVPL